MAFSGGVDEMSGAELLDTADALARGILESEAQLLVVAAQWAVVNGPDTIDPEQAKLPGRQTAKSYRRRRDTGGRVVRAGRAGCPGRAFHVGR